MWSLSRGSGAVVAVLAGIAATALLSACVHAPATAPPTASGADQDMAAVPVLLRQDLRWASPDLYAKITYPVVAGAAAGRLNPVIQRWLGARCPEPQARTQSFNDVRSCAAAYLTACQSMKTELAGQDPAFGCTLDALSDVRLDAAGMLSVVYTTYAYTGGAHGNTVVSYLNLDLHSGRALSMDDLLDHPVPGRLTALIETAMRHDRHIAATRSLEQAGFLVGKLPMPDDALALPQGLLFTYQSYTVAPYVMGQPSALVPWSALAGMVGRGAAVQRLIALGERLERP